MAEEDQKGIRETVRRKSDRFLFDLFRRIESTKKVKEGLRELLAGLEELGYLYPRVYRYDIKENKYVLVGSLNLPPEDFVPEKTSFEISNPILRELEEIIKEGREEIYINGDISRDLVEEKNDPLAYILEMAKGEKVGLVGIPYVGFSEIYNGGEIRGAIALNYNPLEKIVDEREKEMLKRIGILVGVNVIRQLENRQFHRQKEKLEELNRQLALQVKLDGPTGLYNKKTFHEDLEGYTKEIKERGKSYHLILIDLDSFKIINDRFGHAEGDKAILEIGNLLRGIGRRRMVKAAYRVGGDEFGLVVETGKKEEAASLAEEIQEKMKGIRLPEGADPLGASLGIAGGGKGAFNDGEEWYDKADAAAYKAKKGRIVFYE